MSERMKVDKILLSDLHLGLGEKNARLLARILQDNYEFEELHIVGDGFEHFNFRRYSKEDLDFLTWLFSLRKKIKILPGNHDSDLPPALVAMSQGNIEIIGSEVYEFEHHGKKIAEHHGHIFDQILEQEWLRIGVYGWFEKRFREADRWIDWWYDQRCQVIIRQFRHHPYWKKCLDNLSSKALAFAYEKGYDYIICGHVHEAAILSPRFAYGPEKDGPTYINLGCWIDSDHTLGVIGPDGSAEICLHQYSPDGELIGIVSC